MKLNFRLVFITALMFLIFGCATKKTIDYNSVMEETGTVELDADFNGATDVSKGGTNVQSYSALKTVLSLDNVDNTSDLDKPISDLTQTEIDTKADQTDLDATNTNVGNKEDTLPIAVEDVSFLTTLVDTTRSFLSIAQTKIALSLDLVDNTSDTDKPISTLTQNALDLKADQADLGTTNTAVALNTAKVTEQDAGTNTGDQVGDGVTITGAGTVGDPFVAVGGGSMVYPGAGIPLSTGSAWGTSYTSTTLAQLLYGEDWIYTATVDLRNATAVNMGSTIYATTATLPTTAGREDLLSGVSGHIDGTVFGYGVASGTYYQHNIFGLPSDGDSPKYSLANQRVEWKPDSGAGITEVATDPTINDLTSGQFVISQATGDLFGRGSTGLFYEITGATPIQYYSITMQTPTNGKIESTDGLFDCGDGGTDCGPFLYADTAAPEFTATGATGYDFTAWTPTGVTDTSDTTNPDNITIAAADVDTFSASFSATASTAISQWRFESGALTTDSVGTNTLTNNNTAIADIVNYKEGSASTALDLVSSQYYNITDTALSSDFPLKSGTSNLTLTWACWIYAEPTIVDTYILSKYNRNGVSQRSLALVVNADNTITIIQGHTAGASGEVSTATAAITDERWYHVAITYDDSDQSYKVRVWDDFNSTNFTNVTGTFGQNISLTVADFIIGARDDGANSFLTGNVDDVQIFDSVLSDAEIDALR